MMSANESRPEKQPLRPGSRRRWTSLLLVPLTALLLAACGDQGGLSQEDATAIRQQLEEVANRLDAVEQRLLEVSEQNDGETVLISDVQQVTSDVGEAKDMLNDVTQQLAAVEDTAADDGALDGGAGDPLDTPLDQPLDDPLDAPLDDPLDAPLDEPLNEPLNQPLNDPLVPAPEGDEAPAL